MVGGSTVYTGYNGRKGYVVWLVGKGIGMYL